ncbi:hypothetical protein ACDQ55_17455 [Chitinophaga sp. 30R24]|uniref:hypothetical protein n=1 Tax=Chitinophaga sp. 30R24 TaxID=3248838 RepID=UPI003B902DFB
MKYLLSPILYIVLHISCNIICTDLFAQDGRLFSVTMKDSLGADKQTRFLYNNLKIVNSEARPISFNVSILVPEGWRLLAPARQTTQQIEAGATLILPVILMKQQNTPAKWLPVSVEIKEPGNAKDDWYKFYVKAAPVNEFYITPLNTLIQLKENEREIAISTRVKNNGSVDGVYSAEFKNNYLDINHTVKLKLSPGMDTVFTYKEHLTENAWNHLKRERIIVTVTDTSGTSYINYLTLEKIQHELKDKPSPYPIFPLYIEGGVIQWGSQTNYYGGIRGEAMLNNNNKLSFYYRSKQYGLGKNIDKNIFGIDYTTKRWELYLGHMSDIRYFYVYGTGFRVSYKPGGRAEVSLSVSKHDNLASITNNNVTGAVKYGVGHVMISHALSADIDNTKKYNSFLFSNEAQLLKKDNISLYVNAGVGKDISTLNLPGTPPDKLGGAGGYSFNVSGKKISFVSQMQYNSDYYPGLNKGLQIQYHTFNWKFGSNGIGAFYQYNRTNVRTLRDTLYNTDDLKFNLSKYGLTYSHVIASGNASISGGRLQQTGTFSNTLPEYTFLEILYTQRLGKNANIYLNTINGYNASYGTENKKIFITTSTLSANYSFFGLKGYYVQTPVFDRTDEKKFLNYQQTLLAGPYFNFVILKRIKTNLYDNISKTLYDSKVYNLIGCNIYYHSPHNGFDINAMASIPTQTTTSTAPNGLNEQYVSLSVIKKFNVPLISRRKYYTLNLLPFYDVNGNGVMDAGEQSIPNLQISVNDIPFISDAKGLISYKNIEPADYHLDYRQTNTVKGMVPASGLSQTIPVYKDITVMLPFKKSSVISGSLTITNDTLSTSRVLLENIKVIATDSSGVTYSTLTDVKGAYFLNVPAGKYSVSLNPSAFTDKVKPKVIAYTVDLTNHTDGIVNFEIVDKSREIRFFKEKQQ